MLKYFTKLLHRQAQGVAYLRPGEQHCLQSDSQPATVSELSDSFVWQVKHMDWKHNWQADHNVTKLCFLLEVNITFYRLFAHVVIKSEKGWLFLIDSSECVVFSSSLQTLDYLCAGVCSCHVFRRCKRWAQTGQYLQHLQFQRAHAHLNGSLRNVMRHVLADWVRWRRTYLSS